MNWFRVPHWLYWLYWLSWRPRRCVFCRRWYLGCWYQDLCSRKCADEDLELCEEMYGGARP